MTLAITVLAAVVASIAWYMVGPQSPKKIGALALMYWGAALMWSVDGIASLIGGEPFIELANTAVMLDDALLGFVVVVAGLAIWALYLLVKRPRGAVR